jgi:broad specificity phosphatase PhoE
MQFIYVIRHGETDANKNNQVNDINMKTSLNLTGKTQAKKTGIYLNSRNLKDFIIYSSPSKRAFETAQIIANEMKYDDNIIIDERLNELDHGLLSGSVKGDDINNEYIEEFNKLPTDPIDLELSFEEFDVKIYNKFKCESLAIASKRVSRFYSDLPRKNIVLITHGGIINVTINVLFNIMPQLIGNVSNGKNCTIMCIMKETKSKEYKLITIPNTLHLQ